MRYWKPFTSDAIASLRARGCERFFHLPLYPQESRATTESSSREIRRLLPAGTPVRRAARVSRSPGLRRGGATHRRRGDRGDARRRRRDAARALLGPRAPRELPAQRRPVRRPDPADARAGGGGPRRPDDALLPEPRGPGRMGEALHRRDDRASGGRGRRRAALRAARVRLRPLRDAVRDRHPVRRSSPGRRASCTCDARPPSTTARTSSRSSPGWSSRRIRERRRHPRPRRRGRGALRPVRRVALGARGRLDPRARGVASRRRRAAHRTTGPLAPRVGGRGVPLDGREAARTPRPTPESAGDPASGPLDQRAVPLDEVGSRRASPHPARPPRLAAPLRRREGQAARRIAARAEAHRCARVAPRLRVAPIRPGRGRALPAPDDARDLRHPARGAGRRGRLPHAARDGARPRRRVQGR